MSRQPLNIVVDIDSIPLPRQEIWLPDERVRRGSGAWPAAAIGFFVIAAFVVAALLPALAPKESGAGRATMAVCSRDESRAALLRAAQAWASGDSRLLMSLLASDGRLTFEDSGRNTGQTSYSASEIPGYLAARVPRVEDLVLGRVEPQYSAGRDGEMLHAFVIRGGLDYPVLFTGGLATCAPTYIGAASPGAVFGKFLIVIGGR